MEHLHWYTFYEDLQNLSTSEFGNCCILNRVASIINQDVSKIKDSKDRDELIKTQAILKSKYCINYYNNNENKEITEKQKESATKFYESLGYKIE